MQSEGGSAKCPGVLAQQCHQEKKVKNRAEISSSETFKTDY